MEMHKSDSKPLSISSLLLDTFFAFHFVGIHLTHKYMFVLYIQYSHVDLNIASLIVAIMGCCMSVSVLRKWALLLPLRFDSLKWDNGRNCAYRTANATHSVFICRFVINGGSDVYQPGQLWGNSSSCWLQLTVCQLRTIEIFQTDINFLCAYNYSALCVCIALNGTTVICGFQPQNNPNKIIICVCMKHESIMCCIAKKVFHVKSVCRWFAFSIGIGVNWVHKVLSLKIQQKRNKILLRDTDTFAHLSLCLLFLWWQSR